MGAMIFAIRGRNMLDKIEYKPFPNGGGFYAYCDGQPIGKITFVRTGPNIVIIDHTEVDDAYRNNGIELNLIRHVCAIARQQHRRVLPICPTARTMFGKYPEFDDVRMFRTR